MLKEDTIKGQKVAVIGIGARTGVSLIRYLSDHGAKVIAYDRKSEDELEAELDQLVGYQFDLELATEEPTLIHDADIFLVSPGVSIDHPALARAKAEEKPVWSEIEFASQRISKPLLAVTGTNGKSTTTTLLASMLSHWGKRVFAGGNLGMPLIEAVEKDYDFVVAEVSSFQLEAVETFHPHVAVLLNITPNHLDRHGTIETYLACKNRIFRNMDQEDLAIINHDDAFSRLIAENLQFPVWQFSSSGAQETSIYNDRGKIVVTDRGFVDLSGYLLKGRHNLDNAMASSAAALFMGCPPSAIEEALSSFKGLPHRMELIGLVGGVTFINDSKSTTPEATVRAVVSCSGKVILIAGGRSKGHLYTAMQEPIRENVKEAVFFGESGPMMAKQLPDIPSQVFGALPEAFVHAIDRAESGDTILFSPANASFDQYENYEDRGRHFVELVNAFMENVG